MQRLAAIVALLLSLPGCGSGVEGPNPYETSMLPRVGEPPPARAGVVLGNPGDHWLETMQYVRVERAAAEGEYGYAVTYDVPGSDTGDTFTLFWSRDHIEFGSGSRRVRQSKITLGSERVMYPDVITADSLPRVHQAIGILEQAYARDADGAIAAMQGFATVASMGPGPRLVRPRGPPPARPAVPAARVAASKFKPFTERNFRENLTRLTGGQPKGAHAHHVFPIKHADKFDALGINIHHPRYGAWWPANQHLSVAKAYNAEWQRFLRPGQTPSVEQVLQKGRALAAEYGFQIHF